MNKELIALEDNHTWDLINLLASKKAISSKCVHKVIFKPNRSVNQFKARLVAKDYNKIEEINYFDKFSPVAKLVTIKLFLAIVVAKS